MGPENIWLVALGGFAAFVANVLYAIGGTDMGGGGKKWIRRFVASFILALAANLIALYLAAWVWQYLLIFPCLAFGFSLGYGADTVIKRVIRRTVFALGVLTACIVGAWAVGFSFFAWVIVALALITGITSVALGVINPFNNAPLEQFIICQVLCLYVPWWAFVRTA